MIKMEVGTLLDAAALSLMLMLMVAIKIIFGVHNTGGMLARRCHVHSSHLLDVFCFRGIQGYHNFFMILTSSFSTLIPKHASGRACIIYGFGEIIKDFSWLCGNEGMFMILKADNAVVTPS